MGSLLRASDGQRSQLDVHTTIGRDGNNSLQLRDLSVSQTHAVVTWDGRQWRIRDTGSLNGTFIDSRQLTPGERVTLKAGQVIRFAAAPSWRVDSLAPPAVPQHTQGADTPTFAIRRQPSVSELSLEFMVGLHDAWVSLTASYGDQTFDLGSRAHLELLLLLARYRSADAKRHPDEAGWVDIDTICEALEMDVNLVYTHVHRARKQFSQLDVLDSDTIIERRPRGLLRLGARQVIIHSTGEDD